VRIVVGTIRNAVPSGRKREALRRGRVVRRREASPIECSSARHEYLQLIEVVLCVWHNLREPKDVLQVLASVQLDKTFVLDAHVGQGATFPLPPGFSERSFRVEGSDGDCYTFDLAFFEHELASFQAQFEFSGRAGIDEARRFNATEFWQRQEKIAGPERVQPGPEPDSMYCDDLHGISVLTQWVFGCPAVSLWATDRRYR